MQTLEDIDAKMLISHKTRLGDGCEYVYLAVRKEQGSFRVLSETCFVVVRARHYVLRRIMLDQRAGTRLYVASSGSVYLAELSSWA